MGALPGFSAGRGLLFFSLWAMLGLLFRCGGGGQAGSVPPAACSTCVGTPDSQFDQLFVQNGPGWTGGDGTYSIQLPDGRTLWMFSDSYIGTVNPQTRFRSSATLNAHNSLVTTDSSGTFTTIYAPGCSASNPCSYFTPSNTSDFYWVGDELVVQPSSGVNEIQMFLLEWTPNISYVGSTIVTLSLPDLAVESYTPLSLPAGVEWGSAVLQDASCSCVYVYGVEDLGAGGKFAHIARTTTAQLEDPSAWTFWNGTGWVSGAQNSVRILSDSISNQYNVVKVNSSYLMVAMDTSTPFGTWKNIVTYTAAAPQGPWQNRTVVYQTPETGQGDQVTYNPLAHPEFTNSSQLLISYNTNTLNASELVNANLYLPKFIRIPLPALP